MRVSHPDCPNCGTPAIGVLGKLTVVLPLEGDGGNEFTFTNSPVSLASTDWSCHETIPAESGAYGSLEMHCVCGKYWAAIEIEGC